MTQHTSSADAVKFAYWVPNVSGGLVVPLVRTQAVCMGDGRRLGAHLYDLSAPQASIGKICLHLRNLRQVRTHLA